MNAQLGLVNLRHRLKLNYSKVTYHLAPLPQYRRKTRYLVLKTPAK